MTAPSNPREALEPFAKAADNYADCADDDKFIDDDATVTVGNLREARAALATLSRPDGEKREAIARIIDPTAKFIDYPDLQWSRFELQRRALAYQKADAILSSGLVQDEAAIRADEREKCARVAAQKIERYVEGMSGVDVRASFQLGYRWKDGPAIAAAIRSRSHGEEQ